MIARKFALFYFVFESLSLLKIQPTARETVEEDRKSNERDGIPEAIKTGRRRRIGRCAYSEHTFGFVLPCYFRLVKIDA
jgi:hypothetical protein